MSDRFHVMGAVCCNGAGNGCDWPDCPQRNSPKPKAVEVAAGGCSQ